MEGLLRQRDGEVVSQGEWHAQVEEAQRRQDEDARAIEAHRKWVAEFNEPEEEHGFADQEG